MREQLINKIRVQNKFQILTKNQLTKLKGGTTTGEREAQAVVDIIIVDDLVS